MRRTASRGVAALGPVTDIAVLETALETGLAAIRDGQLFLIDIIISLEQS
jgi:hypothetical protein